MDTLGLVLAVVVHSASLQDYHGARLVFMKLASLSFPRLKTIWADRIYRGKLVEWVQAFAGWRLEIVQKIHKEDEGKFVLLPRRWIVERTFAWLGRYRRMSKDYEYTTKSSEAWVYIAMIHVSARRLRPT